MPKIPIIKAKDFCGLLVSYGCIEISIRGSHHKIMNPKTGKVSVVAVHAGDDLDKGSFSGILRQLGIDINTFIEFIST